MLMKKFRRTKVADLTVGRSLAFNFLVPIVQIAGYGLALGGAAAAWERLHPKSTSTSDETDITEE